MRLGPAAEVTPLLGSLGLHGGAVLALFLAVQQPTSLTVHRERADAWTGNAVEVDAVATPTEAAAAVPDNEPPANGETTAAEPHPVMPSIAAAIPRAPRPARVATPSHESRGDSEAPAAAVASAAPGSKAGAFGSEGLPPGVRSLPSAFTRAIPPATGADPIWQTLATGVEKPFTIAIAVDGDGHIGSAEILKEKDGSEAAAQFSHLRERVVALLGAGLFALQDNVGAGRELFRITITLSDRAAHEDDAPAELVERGFDPPRGAAPGRAYFTLASGRHFEAKVQVLSTPGASDR